MKSIGFYEVVGAIDDISSSPFSLRNAEKLIGIIKEDKSYENYFFRKVKSVEWFSFLKEKGYFLPERAPLSEETKESGTYRVPEWNVLPYLEQVSGQVGVSGNEKYLDEFLNVLIAVTKHHKEHADITDNYRTWWYFAKILVNIPNDKIAVDIVNLIPIWLSSKLDNSPQGSEIAEKLLPKFLNSENPEDWKKAEKIVEIITQIQWIPELEERWPLATEEEKPKTVLDSYWLLESFKANAAKVGQRCSKRIVFTLADRLREILRRERGKQHISVQHKGGSYRIDVALLKDDAFKIGVGVIEDKDLAMRSPDEQLHSYLPSEPTHLFGFEVRGCSDEKQFVRQVKQKLSKLAVFADLKNEFDEKLIDVFEQIFRDYSSTWLKSIFSQPEPMAEGAKEIITLILRDVVLAKARTDREKTGGILTRFLGNDYRYPIFKKIVLYTAAREWLEYKDFFLRMLRGTQRGRLLNDLDYEAEVYTVLKESVGKLTPKEKPEIKAIIEVGPEGYMSPEEQDKYTPYWKQKWYSALKSDAYFEPLYRKYREITETKEKLYFQRERVRTGPGQSPLTKEGILRTPNDKLAAYLNRFETKDRWKGPTTEALAGALKDTAQENPGKFAEDLKPFLDVGYLYVYEILLGIRDAWNGKKTVDWSKLFEFIKGYIDRDDFWKDEFKVKGDPLHAEHSWVTGTVGELIQEGTRNDSWAFPEEYFEIAKEIIFLILEKERVEEKGKVRDSVTHTLNTPFGKAVNALIHLALRITRVEAHKGIKEKEDVKWSSDIRNKYENLLREEIVEAFTLLGWYLGNFYYLDREWAEGKIEYIEPSRNKLLWEAFMEGYLNSGKVYKDLYELMRQHYLTAIDYRFKEKFSETQLIQHICVGYLRGNEPIGKKESLFKMLLDRWHYSQISEIISFFGIQRDRLKSPTENEDMRVRIVCFWRWVFEKKYKGRNVFSEDDRKLLSNLLKLTVFLEKIDKEYFEWLMLSAPYVDIDFRSSFFVRYLDGLKHKDHDSIRYIGKIFLKILLTSTPTYDRKHICSIVERLYQTGNKEDGNKICNIYGSRGEEFLRDLYEKYRDMQ